jgi:AcrR family transcriptional regulator
MPGGWYLTPASYCCPVCGSEVDLILEIEAGLLEFHVAVEIESGKAELLTVNRIENISEVTIGEIMTAAGLTQGGFYRHFGSKDELYAEAVRQFLSRPPEPWQEKPKDRCEPGLPFASYVVDAYLSRDHLEDVDGACPLIGLSSDVARGGQAVRMAYREVAESRSDSLRQT